MILVFGATGTVGGAVLRQLVARGADAVAAVRTPDRAQSLPGVDVVVADLARPDTLDPALHGVEQVFLASPASPDQARLESALVDAAVRTGRPVQVVKLAALGFDAEPRTRIGASHAAVVERLRASGLPHTVLAPSGFMTNLLANADAIRAGRLASGAGDGGLGWVDPDDLGAVAAHVLGSGRHGGATYDVTGPEVLTYGDVAAQLSRAAGHPVRHVDLEPEQFDAALRSAGVPEWNAAALGELMARYRAHEAEVVTDEVQKATGRPPRSLADWLEQNRDAFLA